MALRDVKISLNSNKISVIILTIAFKADQIDDRGGSTLALGYSD